MDNPFDKLEIRLIAIEDKLQLISEQLMTKRAPIKRFYSIAEASAQLGISRITLYRLTKEGKIPSRRLGSRVMITGNYLEGLGS